MLFRKMLRTVWRYKAQFISMIIMISLGVGVYVGFDMEWYSLKTDGETFMKATHYADYSVYDETGFSVRDAEKVAAIDGVDAVSRYISVNAEVKGSTDHVAMVVTENFDVSGFLVREGEEYPLEKGKNGSSGAALPAAAPSSEEKGIWLSDRFAEENDYEVGDEMTLVYRSAEVSGTVRGLVKASEFMICVADSNQLMPDFTTFGYAYVTPSMLEEAIGTDFYPQLNILSDMKKTELEEAVSDALGYNALVVPKEDTTSYAGLRSEIEEGKAMCAILPELFLMIALLTMITTMHRITTNEKVQIGTLKALGFRDRKIARHYTSFALTIGILGSALGIMLGTLLATMIVNPDAMQGTYFDFWEWKLYLRPSVAAVVAAIILFLTLVGFFSVRSMLRGTAAEALRPHVPKKMKQILLEKTPLWKHFRFGTQWNLRDVLRHKARSLMSFVGVFGCMLLLVAGFGMKDTLNHFLKMLTEDSINYRTEIILTEDAPMDAGDRFDSLQGLSGMEDLLPQSDSENQASDKTNIQTLVEDSGAYSLTGFLGQALMSSADNFTELYGTTSEDWDTAKDLKEEYEADSVSSVSVKYCREGEEISGEADPVTMQIYDVRHGFIHFFTEDNEVMEIGDDGVYICTRIADKGYGPGDEIVVSPYGTDDEYHLRVAGIQRSMIMENMIMTEAYADSAGIDYHYTSLYTDREQSDIKKSSIISGTQSKQAIVDSYDSFNDVMDSMVIVMVLAAVVLGIVVLYNLGVMSYIERYTELATLKVLGFRDRRIASLLISQNLWLSLLGIGIGLPSGILILDAVLRMLASEYELKLHLGILTFCGSVLLTFVVSMLVSFFVARRNKKIDMVESLKGIE